MTGYYPPDTRVLVVGPGGDPHLGEVGTVTETFNDGGDMVHRVAFCEERDTYPHHTGYYEAWELRDIRHLGRKPTRPQQWNHR